MPRSQGLVGSSPTSGTAGSPVTFARITQIVSRMLALLAVVAVFAVAERADAQRRDFVGRVVSIDAQSLAVKDRRANIVTFTRAENTVVEGKTGWESIAAGDEVLVRWNLGSGIVRQVIVLEGPPRAAPR